MDTTSQEYRGFTISVTPLKDHDDLWDFEYRIVKDGTLLAQQSVGASARSQTLGGHIAADGARLAGLEVAKIEIDNLIAMGNK